MGTSLAMIDATYGHLAPDAEGRSASSSTAWGRALLGFRRRREADLTLGNLRWRAGSASDTNLDDLALYGAKTRWSSSVKSRIQVHAAREPVTA